jgi:hypothetical protein
MTQRLKKQQRTSEDVVFEIAGEWYLVPFFCFTDLIDDVRRAGDLPTAAKLLMWWENDEASVTSLEMYLQKYTRFLTSFILYN